MSLEQKSALLALLKQKEALKKAEKDKEKYSGHLNKYFIDDESSKFHYEGYDKHVKFFSLGKKKKRRALLGGNRTGKTVGGAYEVACHATGLYPEWWPGKKFTEPTDIWVAGDTQQTTRDVIQHELCGPLTDLGSGMIAKDLIFHRKIAPGIPDSLDHIVVKHVSGGLSRISFKSYVQGRKSFQGTAKHVVWLDEEPPMDVYGECGIRTMTTDGLVLCTLTPLEGMTQFIKGFMESITKTVEGKYDPSADSSAIVMISWDDVPHLSEEDIQQELKSTPPHLVNARRRGIPTLGSGAIFPVDEEFVKCAPFTIPDSWLRWYSVDVGWRCTAVTWWAWDKNTGNMYVYDCYKLDNDDPDETVQKDYKHHAQVIKDRGPWMRGAIDPHSRDRSQVDGRNLMDMYVSAGLNLVKADNAVETSISMLYQGFRNGTIKIFSTLEPIFDEYRRYHRNEKGEVVKKDDHLMDCLRYGVTAGKLIGKATPSVRRDRFNSPTVTNSYGGKGARDYGI